VELLYYISSSELLEELPEELEVEELRLSELGGR